MIQKKIAGLLLMVLAVLILGGYFLMLMKGKAVLALVLVVSCAMSGLFFLVFWVGFVLLRTKDPEILLKQDKINIKKS